MAAIVEHPTTDEASLPLIIWSVPVLIIGVVLCLSILLALFGLPMLAWAGLLVRAGRTRRRSGLWPKQMPLLLVVSSTICVLISTSIYVWAWTESFSFGNPVGYLGLVLLAIWTALFFRIAVQIWTDLSVRSRAGCHSAQPVVGLGMSSERSA